MKNKMISMIPPLLNKSLGKSKAFLQGPKKTHSIDTLGNEPCSLPSPMQ